MSGRPRLSLGVALLLVSCGGNSERSEDEGAKKATGGSNASGGSETGGSSAGGTTAGTGASTGGTGGTIDVGCAGIRNDTPCPVDGVVCSDLECGPGGVGRRDCACATTWSCTSCAGVDPWPPDPDIQACPPEVMDGVSCLTEQTVCGPVGIEYCACYANPDTGILAWDCNPAPEGLPGAE